MFGPFVGCIDSGGGKFRINFSILVILFKKPVRESPRRIHAFQDPFLPDFSGKALFLQQSNVGSDDPAFLSRTQNSVIMDEGPYPSCRGKVLFTSL